MNNGRNESTRTPAGTGRRRGVTVGLAGGLLAGTAAGLVFGIPSLSSAASSSTPAVVVQQTDDTDTTTDPGAVPVADPSADAPEIGTRLREALQSLVDDGTITAAQADAVTTKLVESRPDRGEFGAGHGPGGRHGGPGMFGRGVASEALTDLLGLDAQELREQLRDGATLAEIATAQGVEVQAVVDELVGELEERVNNAVENGRIDQEQADEKLAEAEAKITDLVNNGMVNNGGSEWGGPDHED